MVSTIPPITLLTARLFTTKGSFRGVALISMQAASNRLRAIILISSYCKRNGKINQPWEKWLSELSENISAPGAANRCSSRLASRQYSLARHRMTFGEREEKNHKTIIKTIFNYNTF